MLTVKRISTTNARDNFSDVLGQVYYTKQAVMVERKGKPIVAIVSLEQFKQIQRIKERGFAVIDEIQASNADKDQDQIDRDVTTAVETVRQEMYEQRQQATRKNSR